MQTWSRWEGRGVREGWIQREGRKMSKKPFTKEHRKKKMDVKSEREGERDDGAAGEEWGGNK